MPESQHRLLFTGPFHADHRSRALDALCAQADAGARDILYIVASSAARRRAIGDLLARREAVFGLRVVTLHSLPGELARRAHLKEPEHLDGVIDELLVERELRAAAGGRFAGATPVRGLASKAASTIDLLERNGGTPAELEAFLNRTDHAGDGARVITQAWTRLALKRPRHGRTDAAALIGAVELLREHPDVLSGLDVLVLEDLALLSRIERSVVRSLVSIAPGHVIASHGYITQLPTAPSTRSLRALREVAVWDETECSSPRGHRADHLARLFAPADAMASNGNGAHEPTAASTVRITRLESTGDLGEVRSAARVVRRHLDEGVAPEQIALVAHGGAARYRQLVREVFGAAGIPVAVALPRPLAETAIGGVLLRLLELAILPERMTRETSLAVARTPHLDLHSDDGDRLQAHVVRKGYLGLDGWDDLAREALGDEAVNRVNQLKRAVATARTEFGAVSTPKHAARVVRQLARELRLTGNAYFARHRTARRFDSGDPILGMNTLAVREDNLAWEAIGAALDATVPTMLGIDRALAGRSGLEYAAGWLAMLTRVMQSDAVTSERAPVHAVQFRSTGPGCEAPARVTIVLGLLEKMFPRQPRQDPFLNDELRGALASALGWDLPTTVDAVDRERECFIRAISSATESLYLSYAARDADGRPGVRSFFIDDLQAAVGEEHPIPVVHSGATTAIASVNDAATASALLAAVSHDVWQYLPHTADGHQRRATAFRALEALARKDSDVSTVRHGRRVTQTPALDGVLPGEAPHLTLALSASQLKAVSHCTYQHFVQKILVPEEIVAPEYNALTKGSLIHDAIMHWTTVLRGWTRGEAALAELQAWARDRIDHWSPAQRGTMKTKQATEDDLRRLDEFLRKELAHLRVAGVAQPTFAELAFGEEPGERGPRDAASRLEAFPLQVPTSKGIMTVKFRGSMDRVDVFTVDGRRYAVIIDYKTGKTSKYYADDMMKDLDLQLRLYCLVLQDFWDITPVGALYLGFGDGVRRGAIRKDFARHIAGIDLDAKNAIRPLATPDWQGFIDETKSLIAPLVDRLVRLDVTPAPRNHDCGFCELTPVCRYDRWAPAS